MEHHQQITIISTEVIKPSSPTPRHLSTFKLSLLDNQLGPFYAPFVFFYPALGPTGSEPGQRINTLKSSLAHALTRFYPLAGRLSKPGHVNNQTGPTPVINCNDEGALFSVARVVDGSGSLTRFLSRRPELDSLQEFLPFSAAELGATGDGIQSAPQVAVRATVFPCGGIAVGVCLLHKIVDGRTFADFMKLWAAIASGDQLIGRSDKYAHDRAATSLFPARHDDDVVVPSAVRKAEDHKTSTRRFVFDGEAISALKARSRSGPVPDPTRCEVVFGFLWKSVVNATASARGKPITVHSVAGITMDLRPRMKYPWPDYSIGNMLWFPPSIYDKKQQSCSLDNETTTLRQLVHKLRTSIAKLDADFMEKLEGGNGREEYMRNQDAWRNALLIDGGAGTDSESKRVMMKLTMSSVVGMGLYDVDFGWGKPVWICLVRSGNQVNNVVTLMESSVGYGIEAWITLHERDMVIMERDPEVLAYAKSDPEVMAYAKNNPNVLGNYLARL